MPRTREKAIRKTTKGKGRNYRTVKEGAGMTAAGVAAHRRKIQSRNKNGCNKKEKFNCKREGS